MSTPTTARGALLRRAGTLLVAAALVGAPATSAFADPTASPTASPTRGGEPDGIRLRRSPSPERHGHVTAERDPHHQPVGHHVAEPQRPGPLAERQRAADQPQRATPSAADHPGPGRTSARASPPALASAADSAPGRVRRRLHRAARSPPATTTTSTRSSGLPDSPSRQHDRRHPRARRAPAPAGPGRRLARLRSRTTSVDYTGFGLRPRLCRSAREALLAVAVAQGIDPDCLRWLRPARQRCRRLEDAERSLLRPAGRLRFRRLLEHLRPVARAHRACIRAGEPVSADVRRLPARPAVRRRRLPAAHGRAGCAPTRRRRRPRRHGHGGPGPHRRRSAPAADGRRRASTTSTARRQGASGGAQQRRRGVNANTTGRGRRRPSSPAAAPPQRAAAVSLPRPTLQYGCDFARRPLRGGIALLRRPRRSRRPPAATPTSVDTDRRSTAQAARSRWPRTRWRG